VDREYPLSLDDPGYTASRVAMGQTRRFAERMNLARMTPGNELASLGYCLANPGVEYLVYWPAGGEDLSVELKAGTYRYEWFDPEKNNTKEKGTMTSSGGAQRFKAPFVGDVVLYLKARRED
jgi:hypothetical protein